MNEKKKWFPTGGRFLSTLTIVLIGIGFYWVLNNLGAVKRSFGDVLDVLTPFLVGMALAYLLNAPTVFLERKVFHRFRYKRIFAITGSYLFAAAIVMVLMILVLPQVIQSVISLINNSNTYLANFSALLETLMVEYPEGSEIWNRLFVSYQDIFENVSNFLLDRFPEIFNFGLAIGNGLVSAITALISSIYMLFGKERLLGQMRRFIYAVFPKETAVWILSVCDRANGIFSGFIIGKIIDSAIIGVLCFLLCTILRIPLAMLVGVVVGFTNIIPFFGPFIGAIPCIMVLLIVDPWAALRFGILILALQQFDGNILGPRILGDSTGLSAIWVLVAIVVGGGLFGFPGMLVGVPSFAVLYALTRDWVDKRLAEKNIGPEMTKAVPPKE